MTRFCFGAPSMKSRDRTGRGHSAVRSGGNGGAVPAAPNDSGQSLVAHQPIDGAPRRRDRVCTGARRSASTVESVGVQRSRRVFVRGASVTARWTGAVVLQLRARGTTLMPLLGARRRSTRPGVLCTHVGGGLADQWRGSGISRVRGTSSLAKKIEADVKISFASRRARTSSSRIRSVPARRWCEPVAFSTSIRVCRVQVRSGSTPHRASGLWLCT